MAGKKLKLSIFGIVVVAIAAIGIKYAAADSSNLTVNWTGGAPTLEKVNDYSSTPPGIPKCTTVKIPVQRSYISSPIEEHCFVQTAMGLMTQLYRNDGVVQAQSYAKGYPVNFLQGGNPSIDPIPNQASGIYASVYSQGPGLVYGYVPQISNVLQFKVGVGGMYYEIPAGSNISKTFAKAAGGVAPFNSATKSISANGRYMVIDGLGAGFIRINLMNLTVRSFSPTLIKVNGTSLLDANTAIDDSGRFAAIAYNAPDHWGSMYFKLVDVNSCTTPEMDYRAILDRNSFNCQSVDLLTPLMQTVPTVKEIFNLQFSNDRTVSFDVAYTSGSSTKYTRYSITAPGQSRSLKQYLALGDSYISGEGAYSYREGTDTSRNLCHQSLLSYPYLLGAKFSSFASVACSGARMRNVTSDGNAGQLEGGSKPTESEKDQAAYDHLPGFIAQRGFANMDNPDAITVSIGGNDIGFGDIVKQCVNPIQEGWHGVVTAETCYDNYEDRAELVDQINSKFTELRSLYRDLKDNGDATGRRVYVIAYPQVVKVGGECGQNVLMNSDEVQFAHDMVAYLDNVIKRAADEAGV
jgi:lysophospholipase L1-like esterase